ncbi:MAG: bifunctional 4-hydroxy-2-oxoglutarate aldolase/2-dehydro-3-deoxy-phosphogluconate aldolase [Pseudomonadota bacterium]
MAGPIDEERDIAAILTAAPIVPVLVLDDVETGIAVARALAAGGMTTIEVTLRTRAALDVVKAIREAEPDVVVGVGSVRTPAQLSAAALAGAAFAVSPGASPKLLDAARGDPLPFLPGAATASEAMALAERGYRIQKFFPAVPAGGLDYLAALAGPLPELGFCPTGGIDQENAARFLALANVIAVGGSWMAPAGMIEAGDWAGLTERALAATSLVLSRS